MSLATETNIESSYARPVGLMFDCHRRIEKFLQQLAAITGGAIGRTLTDEEADNLDRTLRYFENAAPLHSSDEERSLFPRLRSCNVPEIDAELRKVAVLEAEHLLAASLHAQIDSIGKRWLTTRTLGERSGNALRDAVANLASLYREHIAVEDNVIFPLAESVLNEATMLLIGREMADRRGIDLDALPDLKAQCPSRFAKRITSPLTN